MTACCPFCGAESDFTSARCRDCQMALVEPSLPPPETDEDADEVVYELDDWPVSSRVRLTAALIERAIPCRWEPGLTLVVAASDDERAEEVLDEIEDELEDEWDDVDADDGSALPPVPHAGPDGGDDVDGDVAQAAMADLFVAADRLMHEPTDELVAAELGAAAAVVEDSPPPYGIDPDLWDRIRALAAVVLGNLDEEAEEEDVSRDARVLRDVLRPWV